MFLLGRCSDNYNTIRFYHFRDVVMTIIIQYSLSLLWRCSDNYNAIRFCHFCDVFLTIIIQFCLSLFWCFFYNYNTILFFTLVTLIWQLQHNSLCHSCEGCSDNYNTIRFYHSRDVVLTIIMQFVFVTFVMFFWQL